MRDLPVPIETQTAIDTFSRSLAQEQGERAIRIILSGTGSHGTLGIREIKRYGGMTMAQSPESAEFDQMPTSAIETGLVDSVLPTEQMPKIMLNYIQQPYVKSAHRNDSMIGGPVLELDVILTLILEPTRYDFHSYRKNMLMRRVERRMGLPQIVDIEKDSRILQTRIGRPNSSHSRETTTPSRILSLG